MKPPPWGRSVLREWWFFLLISSEIPLQPFCRISLFCFRRVRFSSQSFPAVFDPLFPLPSLTPKSKRSLWGVYKSHYTFFEERFDSFSLLFPFSPHQNPSSLSPPCYSTIVASFHNPLASPPPLRLPTTFF